MGVLDDAIREHLDLQRRRGADPAEIERAEREALGPVRRSPEAAEQLEPAADQPPAYDQDGEADWDEPFEDEFDDYEVPGATEAETALHPLVASESATFNEPPITEERLEPPEEPFSEEPLSEEPFSPEDPSHETHSGVTPTPHPAPASPPRPQQPDEQVGQQTTEYTVEGALEEGGAKEREDGLEETGRNEGEDGREETGHAEGEDVLEETPEFLQDTPDHDRLWFEQRPPRDFDFNG